MFGPTGIYDNVISHIENPRIWDTRGANLFAHGVRAGIFLTRGKTPAGIPVVPGYEPNIDPPLVLGGSPARHGYTRGCLPLVCHIPARSAEIFTPRLSRTRGSSRAEFTLS